MGHIIVTVGGLHGGPCLSETDFLARGQFQRASERATSPSKVEGGHFCSVTPWVFWQKLLAGKSPGFMVLTPWSEEAGVQVLRLWSAQGQLQPGSQKRLRDMGKLGISKGAVNQWGTGTFCGKGKGRAWAGPD